MPWGFFYDALFKEDENDKEEEEENHRKKDKDEEKKRELCDVRVINMEELMNELDLGPMPDENSSHNQKKKAKK